ncbi:MAG: porin, partial [Cyclobacteriaceae bacterium]|nr:porin [Cyclobacteriaceae bacterium]
MKSTLEWLGGFMLCLTLVLPGFGQDTLSTSIAADEMFVDHSYKPLTLKLTDDGSKYVRFLIWNQLWMRATENNPGTLGVDGQPNNNSFDIGIRRARFLAYAQISPRFLILSHWGINNQTFTNGGVPGGGATGNPGNLPVTVNPETGSGAANAMSAKKPQMFFHDIWTEFMLTEELYIGAGLHYWNGISRMSSHSTLSFMAIDAPIFNWPLIELTDQFARQFGIYAKGQISNWDYRIALNKPFSIGAGGSFDVNRQRPIAANVVNDQWATQGYIAYQFLEKENNKLPFFTGSYLGTKKVFNIGGG